MIFTVSTNMIRFKWGIEWQSLFEKKSFDYVILKHKLLQCARKQLRWISKQKLFAFKGVDGVLDLLLLMNVLVSVITVEFDINATLRKDSFCFGALVLTSLWNKSDVKRRNTLGYLNQFMCIELCLWNSLDRKATHVYKYVQRILTNVFYTSGPNLLILIKSIKTTSL